MNDQENVIVGKGEKTKAIQDHLIEDGHHDEAEAFSVVDFLVREYLLCPKDDLHEGAFKIRELLSDIVGAWQPRQPEQAIAEADMMLHIAEGQLLGYYLSSCGTSITELVESMGLEQGEWENLSGRVNLKDVDRQEIEEYFLAVCEGGGE